MNDITSVAREREELIKLSNQFPIDFEDGSPFGISERTIIGDKGEIKGSISPMNVSVDITALQDLKPQISQLFDEQLERSLTILRKMPGNPYILNNIGMSYLSKGDIKQAKVYFNKALEVRENFRPARANLAKIYIMQEDFDKALAIYMDDEKTSPRDSKLIMNMAHAYLRQGNLELAKDKLDLILSFDKENSAAYHNRGIILLTKNRLNEAISDFRKALSFNQRSAISYNALGLCYLLRNKYQQAIKYFTISLNIDRSSITTLKNLAITYQSCGDFRKSAHLMENHLIIHSMDVNARSIAAFSYFKMNNYEQSYWHLEYLRRNWQQLSLNEEYLAQIFNNIGVIYSYLHKFDLAKEMYQKSIKLCSDEHAAITYCNLVELYIGKGRSKDADDLLNKYLSMEPNDYTPLILIANYYFKLDDYVRAHDLLMKVPENVGETADALALLANVYEASEDFDKAFKMAERVYQLKPSDPIAVNNLAYYYLRTGHLHDAKDLLDGIRWQKDYFFAYATKGLLRIMEGDVQEGEQLYNKAENLALKTEWKRLVRQKKHVELGRHYLKSGDNAKATWHLKRALSINPKQELYKYEAERLLAEI